MTKKMPKRNIRPGIDKYGRSDLHYAIVENDEDKVMKLIQNGFDINLPDDNGWTPLHFAAQNYSEKIIKLLIESGANINSTDAYGNTPLFKAVFNSKGKNLKILDLFINAGANLQKKNKTMVSVIDLVNTIDDLELKEFFKTKKQLNI